MELAATMYKRAWQTTKNNHEKTFFIL